MHNRSVKIKGLVAGVVMSMLYPVTGYTEEIKAFALTGIDGQVGVRYLADELEVGTTTSDQSKETRETLETELFVLFRGYSYHPNFLNFDFGGGPLFVASQYESETESESDKETLYNFVTRLRFLETRPTPVFLYYEYQNPSVAAGISQFHFAETEKYGFTASVLETISPVFASLSGSRTRTEGEGIDIITKDITDRGVLRLYKSLKAGSFVQLTHDWSRIESESGNPDLLITPTTTETNATDLTSRAVYGRGGEVRWNNVIAYHTTDQTVGELVYPTRTYSRFNPDVRWNHDEHWYSFYRYDYNAVNERDIDTAAQSYSAGISRKIDDGLSGSLEALGDRLDAETFQRESFGGLFSLKQRSLFSWGSTQLSGSIRHQVHDQDSDDTLRSVFGEQVTLTGTTPEYLDNSFIDTASIVVSNLARTQVYVEGVDYQILTVGNRVQIARLVAGAIADGQQVLVDYNYDPGGSVVYSDTAQNYYAGVNFFRILDLYARYYQIEQDISEGDERIVLNTVHSYEYGVAANTSFWRDVEVGADATFTDHDEDISPYQRWHYSAYVQVPFFLRGQWRIKGRRTLLDNLESEEDIDLVGYGTVFRIRPWRLASLGYEGDYEKDTGGSVDRERLGNRLFFDWRIRQLVMTAQWRYVEETQGLYERKRNIIGAEIKRVF